MSGQVSPAKTCLQAKNYISGTNYVGWVQKAKHKLSLFVPPLGQNAKVLKVIGRKTFVYI